MDLKKLTPGELVVAIAGVLLFVFGFFKWYGIDFEIAGRTIASASNNGWEAPNAGLSIIAIILGIVMAGHVILQRLAGMEMPQRLGQIGWGHLYVVGGGLSFLFVLIKLLNNTDFTKFGVYAGLICSLALFAGGIMVAKERDELNMPGAARGGGATPPAA